MKLKPICFTGVVAHWERLSRIAQENGQTASSYLRLLIVQEIKRVAKEEAATK